MYTRKVNLVALERQGRIPMIFRYQMSFVICINFYM
jgi:hypothetical protein